MIKFVKFSAIIGFSRYLARCQCLVFYQQNVCVMYLEIVRVCVREVVIVVAW